jgi:ribose-phosphate pyrophosphokinase
MFESVGTDRVIVLDVHNEAAFDNAFRCRTARVEAAEIFAAALAEKIGDRKAVVASPDLGGIKRAQRLSDALIARLGRRVEFAFVEKRRAAGVVSGEAIVGPVEQADVIFYDDMIVSGGTILRAARAAHGAGAARIHVVAPHAAFVPAALEIFQGPDVDSVLVSDSVPLAPAFQPFVGGRLTICSIAPLLARAITDLKPTLD